MAHRQEITCMCFLDPLPCLATADTTGKVLLWATRPHPNARNLLVVIRNTVITGGAMPNGVLEPGSARVQRKVLPTTVTCIAFRHAVASAAENLDRGAAAGRHEKESKDDAGSATPIEHEGPAANKKEASAPSVAGAGSLLITGDELGMIKIWDMSSVLVDRLGAATCGNGSTEDAAAVPPTADSKKSHQFVHHRQGPLDGVGLQAVRLRELIDIAKVLRRGDHLPPTRGEADGISGKQCLPEENFFGSGGSGGGGGDSGNPAEKTIGANALEARSCLCGQSAGSSAAKSGGNLTSRSRLGSSTRSLERAKVGVGGASIQSSSISAPGTMGGRERSAATGGQEVGTDYYSKVTAVLNARVENIDPAASWKGHDDSITSMQVRSSFVAATINVLFQSCVFSTRLHATLCQHVGEITVLASFVPLLYPPPPLSRFLSSSPTDFPPKGHSLPSSYLDWLLGQLRAPLLSGWVAARRTYRPERCRKRAVAFSTYPQRPRKGGQRPSSVSL